MKLPSRGLPFVVLAVALAGPCAAETTPYYIGGVVSYAYNSNVLGMFDGQSLDDVTGSNLAALGYKSKSDDITSIALIGGFDQQIGRQRVFGDVTLRKNDYARNNLLDNDSYALTAGADLQTAERVSGNVLLKSSRDQVKFGTFERPTGDQNLVRTDSADFSVRIGRATRLTFDAAVGYRSLDYSAQTYDARDYNQTSGSLGATYWPSSNSHFGSAIRATNGRYPGFVVAGQEENFDRRDLDFNGWWQLSGVTSLDGRLSYTRIDYALENDLDFSGFTGVLRGTWQPTVKLLFGGEIARDRGQDLTSLSSAFTRVDSPQVVSAMRLRASYEATAKIGLNANLGYSRRPVSVSGFDIFGPIDASGSETVSQFSFGAAWTPTRTSRIGCDVSSERRRSDVLRTLNISVDAISCYAQLTIQP